MEPNPNPSKEPVLDFRGLTIGLDMLSGHTLIGTVIGSWANTIKIKDWQDGLAKEIPKPTMQRFFIIIPGGAKGDGRQKKD